MCVLALDLGSVWDHAAQAIKSSGAFFRGSYASLVAQLVKNVPAMQAKKQQVIFTQREIESERKDLPPCC